ncbi:unnamed protein product [Spirodela intermedia]|uniref:FAD-binding domain-containing protein n=1 Tax=Spirodela intermedia TaxID=51605 RepID=A0A7I8IF59_SPIIN|nr:unnamed protein product [Spirodela intermedia]CAA6656014.1 unnamed protein product [Spirodela intermedia]
MEATEDVVIVGAGIAGLATALGIHRLGLRSLILEWSDSLRSSGFALTVWANAWRALDELGVADSLRRQHLLHRAVIIGSAATGTSPRRGPSRHETKARGPLCEEELAGGCPREGASNGTIRFSSKVVHIEEQGTLKLLHLADGSTVRTKVLVGCDGVNSVVAKWLGLRGPAYAGRSAARGIAEFPGGHGFEANFLQYVGNGFRSGVLPCDETHVYWFFTFSPSPEEKEVEEDMAKMKQHVLRNLRKVPKKVLQAVERTEPSAIVSSPLRYRWPSDLLWGGICRGSVCLAGDALHAMTPDLGQGGCAALEDGVTLARIEAALEEYAKERKWRSFELICTAYAIGRIQQSSGALMNFIRDRLLAPLMTRKLMSVATFDCGPLSRSDGQRSSPATTL